MKKKFVLGMVVLSMTAAQVSFAAGVGGARAPREVLMEYTKSMKETLLGKGGSAKNLKDAELQNAKSRITKELNSSRAADLNAAMSGEAGKARMESLVTIIAVKRSTENLAKTDAAEAQSMNAAAEASLKLIANSTLVGALKIPETTMKAEEVSLVRDALNKAETMPADIIIQFSKAERDSYTQVLEKYDSIVSNSAGKKSAEESFVDAIMDVKKVDRTKALEIVKKLKECV
ncbi:hypothetical protein AZI86_07440 [Bdellovibrio bacteriovorus]|uniref:Uncharacterized protein n=1 Tax=Bdellovibrio bacteriovorus TaxID=959 RepID=A0A150WRG9_BDEBC|nr:hypothetical protein [Bdellovibrio bacteriovorus]KYG66859.1 hypothetical protein AZI86_07440 [Bdellovibrio bacteriovorus]